MAAEQIFQASIFNGRTSRQVEIVINGLFKSLSDPNLDLIGDLSRPFTAQDYFLLAAFGFAGFFMYYTLPH